MRTARGHLITAVMALLLVLAGCGTPPESFQEPPASTPPVDASTTPPTTPATPTPSPTPTLHPVTVTSNIDDGAEGVTVDTIAKLTAEDGTLSKVSISAEAKDRQSGKVETVTLTGSFNKNKTSWRADDGLEPGATYRVVVQAAGKDGTDRTFTRTFTTQALSLDEQTFPSIYPLDGMKVGVGMPAIIRFDIPVTDRANVEKHLHIKMTPKQQGSWYWVNDSEVHFRPKSYWKAGTKITVEARLNGVNAGTTEDGKTLYGQESRTWSFTIGRKVVAKVDLWNSSMKVYVNDKLKRTIQMSAGKKGFTTRSGTKLIMEKLRTTPMESETQDINDPEYYNLAAVEWAMRLTLSGEFFHAAPWNSAYFGESNRSHGCVGMSNADAKWLFNTMEVGDPAEFTGSDRGMETGNGYTDWNLSWKEVTSKSAL